MVTLPVVTFQHCRDTSPQQSFHEWPVLCDILLRHLPRAAKGGRAWSPVKYLEGKTRSNEGVAAVSCYVADIDDGTLPEALRGGWKTPDGRPLAYALHSTFSSTPVTLKYRVVFPLATPVPAADWPAVHRKLTLALMGGHADPACKDAARLFYLPACPPDALENVYVETQEGDWIDPADFPEPEPDPLQVSEEVMRRVFAEGSPRTVGSDAAGTEKPGSDFNQRGDALALLLAAGWQEVGRKADGLIALRRPGKTDGCSATFGYEGSQIFYCFTSSAAPFEANTSYLPFAVLTLLHYGGDYGQAARDLSQKGYGGPLPAWQQSASSRLSPAEMAPPEAAFPEPAPEMFYGLTGDIVRLIDPHTEGAPVALTVQFLAAFGSAIGRGAHFSVEADLHFGNLFVVIVGESAKARKGTSLGHVRRLLKIADLQWESCCIQTGLSSGEGLIHAVRDPLKKPVTDKKTGITTLETVDEGVTDKRLLAVASEFAAVLRVAGRDGNTLSALLRDAWDSRPLQTMTKNNGEKATGAHISIIAHVTADELRRELSSTESSNGFGNRFLWVCARRSKELSRGGNLQDTDLYPLAGRLSAAIEAARIGGASLTCDQAAWELWDAAYHDLSEGQPGLSGAVTSRGEAQVMRLALLYALLDQSDVIRREHLIAALALWEYCEASALYVFGDALGDGIADDILRALRSAPEGLSRNDIRDLFQRHQSSGRIGQALALLLKYNRAKVVIQTDTGGRPAEKWVAVNTAAKT